MAQTVSRRPLTEEDLVRYEVSICEIYGRKSANGTELFPNKGKGKGHPRTGHEGPEVGKGYSFTRSLTSALDGGGWSTPRPGRFTPGKHPVPIV